MIITVKYPPLIAAISSPSGNVTINQGQSLNFQGSASGGSGSYTAFLWNFGGGATNSTIQNPGSVVFNNSGSYTVTFRVTDSAGNITTSSAIVITVKDITPPIVTVTSPTSGSTYNAGTATTLNIGGTCSDNVAVVSVTWSNSLGGSGSATLGSPATTWSATGIPLGNGSNVLTVTAYDAANNSKSTTLTVTSTNTPPANHAPNTPIITSVEANDSTLTPGGVGTPIIFKDDLTSFAAYGDLNLYDASSGIDTTVGHGGSSSSAKGHFAASEVASLSFMLFFGRNPAGSNIRNTEDFTDVYCRMYLLMDSVSQNLTKTSRMSVFSDASWSQACVGHLWGEPGSTGLELDPATSVSGSTVTAKGWNDMSHFTWMGAKIGGTAYYATPYLNRWTCVEYHMKLNTPGASDGVFEEWIDGVLDAQITNMNWRGSYTAYGINDIDFEAYINSGVDVAKNRWFDHIVVSTSYIGLALSPVNPTIYKSTFSDPDSGDTQHALEGQVSTTADASGLVWDGTVNSTANSIVVNVTNGTFSGALSGQSQLAYNAAYYARVRVSDGTDYSSWSAWYPLKTIQ